MRFFSNSGKKTKPVYEPRFRFNGSRHLEKVSDFPLHEYIQSFKESSSIDNIIRRFKSGDSTALNPTPGAFGDFTTAPTNLADFLNRQIDAHNLFNKLSPEIRSEFNNDPTRFFLSMGTSEFDSILEKHAPKSKFVPDPPKKEVELNNES